MNIIELNEIEGISENIKLNRVYIQFQELLIAIRKKDLPDKIIEIINQDIEDINSTSLINNELRKLIVRKQSKIIDLLNKELKIVPKAFYQNHLFALGGCLGVTIGTSFMISIGSYTFSSGGIIIATVVGFTLGRMMDKNALKKGRQLDFKIKILSKK